MCDVLTCDVLTCDVLTCDVLTCDVLEDSRSAGLQACLQRRSLCLTPTQ
jgi:hypothetical protein